MSSYVTNLANINNKNNIDDSSNEFSKCDNYMSRLIPLQPDYQKLIHNLLQFNPYMRWSASECLNLGIFEFVRDLYIEEKPESKITLDIDKNDAFNY